MIESAILHFFYHTSFGIAAKFASGYNNVYNEYGYVLEQGGYNESDVDQTLVDYQNALDEAGYQDILSEIQSQYEAWKATK